MSLGDKFCGVILAAGVGARIQPLSFDTPKPLLPVCNKPIMQHQIEELRALGIRDFYVVVGHLKERIIETFGDGSSLGVNITYVEQKAPLGIAHAVAQLERHVTRPFVMYLGDIFLVLHDLEQTLRSFLLSRAGAVLTVRREEDPELIKRNFAVIIDEYDRVTRVIEKPRHARSNLKGCGLYVFDLAIFDAIRRTPRTAMRDEYEITTAVQILIDDGHPTYCAEIVDWDMNVTYPHDLVVCNLRRLLSYPESSCVGREVLLHPQASIENSVLGDGVVIENGIRIADSVILPHSVVSARDDLRGVLITPGAMFQCPPQAVGVR
ncbi:MAG: hypothetical protein EPO21_07325 [Chloroflexota bacterium]|nr:MAG: hypothetical protein EPO21_07325 [Chloroflexota bacterium]